VRFDDCTVGTIFRQEFEVSDAKIRAFADMTGDNNPVHLDDAFAAGTRFQKRIAHGMLVASFISKVLGRDFPGDGTIYLSQQVRFRRPVFPGQTVTVEVEVLERKEEKRRLLLRTDVINPDGETVIVGQAEVMKED